MKYGNTKNLVRALKNNGHYYIRFQVMTHDPGWEEKCF